MSPAKVFALPAGLISLTRYAGMLRVAVCLGICLIVINFALLFLTGPAPRAFALGEEYLDWLYFDRAADSAAALAAAFRSGAPLSRKPLIVYTGFSTALQGIDPHRLVADEGCDVSLVAIVGTGASMSQLRALQQPLLGTNLHPSMLIIFLHPEFLAAEFGELPPEVLNPIRSLRQEGWRAAARQASWWNWLLKNRFYVNQLVFKFLYNTRIRLGTVGDTDPLAVPPRFPVSNQDTDRLARLTIEHFRGYGWFDLRRYEHEQKAQAEDLGAVISSYRSRGADVRIVLMPEGSAFRSNVPREAKQYLRTYLKNGFFNPPLIILDFAASIPDTGFVDQIHMNDQGRASFTFQLAQTLKLCPK